MKLLVVGGYGTHQEEHYFPEIIEIASRLGIRARIADLTGTNRPNLATQLGDLDRHKRHGDIDNDTVALAQSLGVSLINNWIVKTGAEVHRLIFISGTAADLPHLAPDIIQSIDPAFYFSDPIRELASVKARFAGRIRHYHGRGDRVVPENKAQDLATALGTAIQWIPRDILKPEAGHLNGDTMKTNRPAIDELLRNVEADLRHALGLSMHSAK